MKETFNNDSPLETPALPAILPESEEGARTVHADSEDDDIDQATRRPSARADWQQTTDVPDEEELTGEEEFVLSPTPLESAPEHTPDHGEKAQSAAEEDRPDPVSNIIKLYAKQGQPPAPQAIAKALNQAMSQGWETIYVYKGNGKTPDYQMAQVIQSFIEQNNLGDRISCCLDPEEYKQCPTAKDVCNQAVENGAVRKKDLSFS